jgi:hypothetical protein
MHFLESEAQKTLSNPSESAKPEESCLRLLSLPSTPQLEQLFKPKISIEFEGSPAVGIVRIFKQVHTIHIEDDPTTQKIGLYQTQIYNHLLRTMPHHHIFFEGLQQDFTDCNSAEFSKYIYAELDHWRNLWEPTTSEQCTSYIREQFKNYSPEETPTDTQLLYLGALGAGRIFAICYSGVTLHKTTDPEFEEKLLATQQKDRKLPKARVIQHTQAPREAKVMREVQKFIVQNPGVDVDLVFGSWHDFSHQASRVMQARPMMLSYEWPVLASALGWNFPRHNHKPALAA